MKGIIWIVVKLRCRHIIQYNIKLMFKSLNRSIYRYKSINNLNKKRTQKKRLFNNNNNNTNSNTNNNNYNNNNNHTNNNNNKNNNNNNNDNANYNPNKNNFKL